MRRIFRVHLLSPFAILGLIEALVLFLAVAVGITLGYPEAGGGVPMAFEFFLKCGVFVTVFMVTKYAIGLYHWDYVTQFAETLIRLGATFLIGFVVLSVIYYVVPLVEIWRTAMAIILPLGFTGVLLTRWIFSKFVNFSYLKRRILVIGAGERAARIEALEEGGKSCRFCVEAFVAVAGEERRVSVERIIDPINSLAQYVEHHRIDELVVAIQDRRGRLPLTSLIDCRLTGTAITDYQTFIERETGRIDLDALRPDWFVFSDGFPGGHMQQAIKRGFDVFASAIALLLLLPLLLATAVAIRLESEGPIFYRQQRVGAKGRAFMLTKFRSMRVDAEKDGVPKWATKNDTRVTVIGGFIRKTRIDEIPQLINVLNGDMSFVGPRPERPYFVDQLSQIIPYYEIRHRVKPGITGWAQVNYPYGASIEDAWQKLQFDLYYIKYYSVLRDFIIILQTVRVIVIPHGAR